MSKIILVLFFLVVGSAFSVAIAQTHKGISFQGVIKLPSGETPTRSGITVNAKILSSNDCVLREEQFTGVNISNGYINVPIGKGNTGGNDPGLTMAEVMDNSKTITNGPSRPAGLACLDSGGNVNGSVTFYNPATSDGARKFRLSLTLDSVPVVADFNMRSMAYAVNSETLNGKKETDLVNINSSKSVTQANVESIFERFTKLDAILNNTNGSGTSLATNITGNATTATTATNVTGTVAVANGGTGAVTASAARTNLGLGSLAVMTPTGTANNTTYLRGDGTWSTVSGGGGGSLSSVGLSLPSIFSVTSSPLTADGTISATLASQSQHHVLAAPNASGGAPAFRALLVSDISNAKSAALYDVPVTGDAGTTQVVKGDDSRLTDARAPIDGSVTDAKIVAVSGSKITGTVPTGTLPVAGSGVAGIVSAIAQSFSGLKTFLNGIAVTGDATISGNVTAAELASTGNISASGAINADRVKLANSSATCDASIEGSIRYNSGAKNFEGCNGTNWTTLSAGGNAATLVVSYPNPSVVKLEPVSFDISYSGGVNPSTISLSSGDITIGGVATSGCTVDSISGSGLIRRVKVRNCTGTGTVNISVAAGTAQSTSGESVSAFGPSADFQVDNVGPSAPTALNIGAVPNNFSLSPTISYSASVDTGGGAVAQHQVKIVRASDSALVKDWTDHTSSSAVDNLILASNTQYSVLVRAIDSFANEGTLSSVSWTTPSDPCDGSPAVGTVCIGGARYAGSLSPGATSGIGTDRYMATPSGCGESLGSTGGSSTSTFSIDEFTPSCSGMDFLRRAWTGSDGNFDSSLPDQGGSVGIGYGETNKDVNYGSYNTEVLVGPLYTGRAGHAAAARYCDRLVLGGYSDWYLPNRYELNLLYVNKALITGFANYPYWSSTEGGALHAWYQSFDDGAQKRDVSKNNAAWIRCVRRY